MLELLNLIISSMKNTIICSFLLSITLFKSYSQLQPDGTGTVNGYNIGPNVILGSSKPKSLSAGYYHNLAIRQDGSIIAKGWNAYSQSSIPRNIGAVTSVAGGYFHSLALTKEGTIVTWGRNNYKQRNVPEGIGPVKAIEAGHGYSMALKIDGTVACWGRNN